MLAVEFVLTIQNFAEHVVDYFRYSKLQMNEHYLPNFLSSIAKLQLERYSSDEFFLLIPNSHLAVGVLMMNSCLLPSLNLRQSIVHTILTFYSNLVIFFIICISFDQQESHFFSNQFRRKTSFS